MQTDGYYREIDSNNYEDYLSAIGAGFIIRKHLLSCCKSMCISISSDQWNILTRYGPERDSDLTFTLNDEIEETTVDLRMCTSTFTKVNDFSIAKREFSRKAGVPSSNLLYVFSDEGLRLEMTCEGVTAIITFERL